MSGNGSESSPNHALWTACHAPHRESVEALQLAAETSLNSSCRAAALASSDAAASKANPLQARLAARTVGESALVVTATCPTADAAGVGGAALNHVTAGALGAHSEPVLALELAATAQQVLALELAAPAQHAAGEPGAAAWTFVSPIREPLLQPGPWTPPWHFLPGKRNLDLELCLGPLPPLALHLDASFPFKCRCTPGRA